MKKQNLLWIVLIFILLIAPLNVEAKPAETFKKVILSNGITLLYRVMKGQPMASMTAFVPIGMDYPKRSIAHLTEHMIFRGNADYSFTDILNVTNRQGGDFSGETSFNATYFNYLVPKTSFNEAFKVFNSTIWSAGLAEQNIALEQKIVVHEAEMNYPSHLEWYPLLHYFYPENNDTVTTVHAITPQDLKEYYRSFYQPANFTYIIAGDFQPEAVIAALQQEKNVYGESDKKIADSVIKEINLPHRDIVEERNLYPYQFQIFLAYDFSDLSPAERMVLKLLAFKFGETYRVDYEKNEYRDYYVAMRSVGDKDLFGLYYLERDRPFDEKIFAAEKANLLKFILGFKKVDIKAERKKLTKEVELERALSGNSAADAVDYELQRLIEPDAITIDSLEVLRKVNNSDLKKVMEKCFSGPPTTCILVKNVPEGGN